MFFYVLCISYRLQHYSTTKLYSTRALESQLVCKQQAFMGIQHQVDIVSVEE